MAVPTSVDEPLLLLLCLEIFPGLLELLGETHLALVLLLLIGSPRALVVGVSEKGDETFRSLQAAAVLQRSNGDKGSEVVLERMEALNEDEEGLRVRLAAVCQAWKLAELLRCGVVPQKVVVMRDLTQNFLDWGVEDTTVSVETELEVDVLQGVAVLHHQALVLVAGLWHTELGEKAQQEFVRNEHNALQVKLDGRLSHLLLLVVNQLLLGVCDEPVDHSSSCADDWGNLASKGWDLHLGEPDD